GLLMSDVDDRYAGGVGRVVEREHVPPGQGEDLLHPVRPGGGQRECPAVPLHHRPRKRGWRFSTKAVMPSCLSSVANRLANSWLSQANPAARSMDSPPSMASLASRSACAGPPTYGRARASACPYTSAAGTTPSASPIRSASSAVTIRPEKI